MSDTAERKILIDKMSDMGASCTLSILKAKHVTAAVSVVSSIDIFVSSTSYVRYYNLDHTKITRDRAIDRYIGQLDNEIDDVTELITTVEITNSLRRTTDKCVSKPMMTDTTDQTIAFALDGGDKLYKDDGADVDVGSAITNSSALLEMKIASVEPILSYEEVRISQIVNVCEHKIRLHMIVEMLLDAGKDVKKTLAPRCSLSSSCKTGRSQVLTFSGFLTRVSQLIRANRKASTRIGERSTTRTGPTERQS